MRPFKPVFERSVNENMHGHHDQPGRAPPEAEDAEVDLKKGYLSPEPECEYEDRNQKKERPPRFSTLFGTASAPLPTPPAVREYRREYYPRPERKSGVFMPMPLFIIFAVILFLETTILFAYTIIGLYNNAPSRIFSGAGSPTVAAYSCQDKQPGVNFAPNFVMPGASQPRPVTEFVTVSAAADLLPASTTSSTSSSTSTTSPTSSTTMATSSADATSVASAIAGILGGLTPDSTTTQIPLAVVTETVAPPRSTVHAVTVISVDPSGNPITPSGSSIPSSTSSLSDSATSATVTSRAIDPMAELASLS